MDGFWQVWPRKVACILTLALFVSGLLWSRCFTKQSQSIASLVTPAASSDDRIEEPALSISSLLDPEMHEHSKAGVLAVSLASLRPGMKSSEVNRILQALNISPIGGVMASTNRSSTFFYSGDDGLGLAVTFKTDGDFGYRLVGWSVGHDRDTDPCFILRSDWE